MNSGAFVELIAALHAQSQIAWGLYATSNSYSEKTQHEMWAQYERIFEEAMLEAVDRTARSDEYDAADPYLAMGEWIASRFAAALADFAKYGEVGDPTPIKVAAMAIVCTIWTRYSTPEQDSALLNERLIPEEADRIVAYLESTDVREFDY